MRPGARNKLRLAGLALVLWVVPAAHALAQSGGFTVSPLDPTDPTDPADPSDPVDPRDPEQGESNAGFGVAINPDMGLIETPLPEQGGGFAEGTGDGSGTFLQVNPGGQDGVALVQTRNTSAATSTTSVQAEDGRAAELRALDRTVGQTTDFVMEVGETVVLGRLAIHLSACRYPVDNPASDAFAQIRIADLEGRELFDGWMIASSPALMALEHPRYDIWVLSCRTS